MDTPAPPRSRLRRAVVIVVACLAVPLLGTAARAADCTVTFSGGPGGWSASAAGCTGAVYVQTPGSGAIAAVYGSQAAADEDWGSGAFVCATAWTCTGSAASMGSEPDAWDQLGQAYVATFPSSDGAVLINNASAGDPPASATDPLGELDDTADGTLWSGLQDGMHDPIMQGVFPLAVVSIAVGLLLLWVRRAARA